MSASVTVPNGRTITGYAPGEAAVVGLEHELREVLATQVFGITEALVPYGRVDVLTATNAFEVEPYSSWRTGARQAMEYAMQTDCFPALALFGKATAEQVRDVYEYTRDNQPFIALWWYRDESWLPIMSVHHCQAAERVQGEPTPAPQPSGSGSDLVSTGDCAVALGVSKSAILLWHRENKITPAVTSPGGHLKWDVERVREELGYAPTPESLEVEPANIDWAGDPLLTTNDCAALLGVSRRTIQRWTRDELITPTVLYPNGYPRYRKSEVLAQIGIIARAPEQAN